VGMVEMRVDVRDCRSQLVSRGMLMAGGTCVRRGSGRVIGAAAAGVGVGVGGGEAVINELPLLLLLRSSVVVLDVHRLSIMPCSSMTSSTSVIDSRAKSMSFLRQATEKALRGAVSKTEKVPMVWPSWVTMGAPA
jgi:hypothetical protein